MTGELRGGHTHASPTPLISTVEPGGRPNCRMPSYAVAAATGSVAASVNDSPEGLCAVSSAGSSAYSAKLPASALPNTASPPWNPSTPAPTSTTATIALACGSRLGPRLRVRCLLP
ncbi:hypothetical protein [Acrocarpospora sp. B8E8]|uniref:hypothetical protein n=1 Tax=Acrocarpospora sp. B8E8 TaxID=3153572 RepID=UPI00325D5499